MAASDFSSIHGLGGHAGRAALRRAGSDPRRLHRLLPAARRPWRHGRRAQCDELAGLVRIRLRRTRRAQCALRYGRRRRPVVRCAAGAPPRGPAAQQGARDTPVLADDLAERLGDPEGLPPVQAGAAQVVREPAELQRSRALRHQGRPHPSLRARFASERRPAAEGHLRPSRWRAVGVQGAAQRREKGTGIRASADAGLPSAPRRSVGHLEHDAAPAPSRWPGRRRGAG